jgi:hypothetical protein
MYRKYLRTVMCLCALGASICVLGQNARFSGQVTDPQGAAIPGAKIELTNKDGGAKSVAESDGEGAYIVPNLPAGHYKVEVSAPNFGTATNDDVALSVGQALTYNVQLTVGQAAVETAQVTESSGVTELQTDNAEIDGTITGKEVAALQLNGRNFTQFIALVPGVSNQTGQDEAKVGVLGSVAYSVNGGRTEYNSFQVDGSETLNVGINRDHSTLVVYPSIDAIQEIKVLTSNYGAQYPSTGSGTTLVTTKSGGDTFHGNLYEFLRNEDLNAKGYFDVGHSAPLYRRNDFGGTIGGPVIIPHLYDGRGKTHFFFSEEWRFEKSPTIAQGENGAYRQAVPSLAERNGDFSDVCPPAGTQETSTTKYPDCPNTGKNSTGTIDFVPNLQGTNQQLNRNAVAILNSGIIPAPNATSGCNSSIGSCYNADIILPTYWREELFRIDHQINSTMQASFRFIHDDWNTTVPVPQWAYTNNTLPTVQNYFTGPGISLVARVTNTFSATLLNEFVASFTNSNITLGDTPAPGVSLTRPAALDAPCSTSQTLQTQGDSNPVLVGQCGISSLFNNGSTKIPGIVVAGNNAAYGGNGFAVDTGYAPWEHSNPVYSFADNMTKILGRHSLQFGGQWLIFQRNQTNAPIGATTGDTQGLLTFSNSQYAGPTGNAFADFLWHVDGNSGPSSSYPASVDPGAFRDGISTYQQDSGQLRYHQRYQIFEPYLQDDFKVSNRLTVNAGLRLSLFGLYHEANKNAYNWVPTAYSRAEAATLTFGPTSGALIDAQTGKFLSLNQTDPTLNLDPRLINGIVRCGYGGVPDGCMSNHLVNPSPRVGFAWDPRGDGKSVLRGGYGVFFEHGTSDEANTGSLEGSEPGVLSSTEYNPPSWSTIGKNENGSSAVFPLNFTAIPTKAHWTYVQQWSASVERTLPWNMLATFGYIGSKGTHLAVERQLNQLQPVPSGQNPFGPHDPMLSSICLPQSQGGLIPTGVDEYLLPNGAQVTPNQPAYINLQVACGGVSNGYSKRTNPTVLRQYAPTLGQIYSLENVANSAYNGFQATLRRTEKSLTLGVAYSYSHSIDNASDRSDTTFVNSYNLAANRASSNFDQRHLLHVNYVWSVPPDLLLRLFGIFHFADDAEGNQAATPAQDWKTAPNTQQLVKGWEVSGITIYETGIPFTVVNNSSPNGVSVLDNAGVANGVGAGAYPDVIGNPHGRKPHGGDNAKSFGPLLLNPGAFAAPRGLTFGNAGRNFLNNPQRVNFDVAILKNFTLPRETNLQFRIEAFNVANNTQFRIYDPVLGNQANNSVSCYNAYPSYNYSAGTPDGSGTDCLTGNAFLHPVDAHRPRTLQLALKYAF